MRAVTKILVLQGSHHLARMAIIQKASELVKQKEDTEKLVKVWDKRNFKNLDGDREIGTRNIKVALRRLRKFAREGAVDELDLDGTIKRYGQKRLA